MQTTQNLHDWAGAKKWITRNLCDSCPCSIHSLPERRQGKWCKLCGIHVVILAPKWITRNSHYSLFLRFTAWSRDSSSFGADCTKSVSLTDVVSEWCEICSVRKQFPLFVYKRLTKTIVEFKVIRHSSIMIIAVWITCCTYHMSNLT